MTTTGFASADYTAWNTFLSVFFLMLMFIAACAGSTSGGFKVVRHVILIKNTFLEIKRQLHRSAVFPLRVNGRVVPRSVVSNVLAFFVIYILTFVVGTLILASLGLDMEAAMGGVASCLGNIGPGLGAVGPVGNYAEVHDAGKWTLSLIMLLGRLELFTFLVILTPHFWRRI
jgi:trk system potassium uptake protein TrkH